MEGPPTSRLGQGPSSCAGEDPATLGEALVLPPFLEPYRTQIAANLKPID